MGTFNDSMQTSYETMSDVMDVEFDGKAKRPAAPASAHVANPAKPAEDTGPGFFSRLWSGIGSAAGKAADLAEEAASRVEFRPISGRRDNALGNLAPPPRPEPPWLWIVGGAAAFAVLVAWMTRR